MAELKGIGIGKEKLHSKDCDELKLVKQL